MTLSAQLWAGIWAIYDEILRHPFLTGLTDGTLEPNAFAHYVIQDAYYLEEYARALAHCAARAPTDADVEMFARHARDAIAVERSLHAGLLADLGVDAATIRATPVAPTTLAYASYLLATCATGSFPAALGAILPCYWIYRDVGRALMTAGSPDARYQRWIETYAAEEFDAVVTEVIELTDRLGPTLSDTDERAMTAAFRITARYEWMFWDAAYRDERWPL